MSSVVYLGAPASCTPKDVSFQLMPSGQCAFPIEIYPINISGTHTITITSNTQLIWYVYISKCPFNFGAGGDFCINQDAQLIINSTQNTEISFSVNLSQYYVLVVIVNSEICNIKYCSSGSISLSVYLDNNLQTFYTISTEIYENYDGEGLLDTCPGISLQTGTPGNACNSANIASMLINQNCEFFIIALTCTAFYVSNPVYTSCPIGPPSVPPSCTTATISSICPYSQFPDLISYPDINSTIPSNFWNQVRKILYQLYATYPQIKQMISETNYKNVMVTPIYICNYVSSPLEYEFINLPIAYTGELVYASDMKKIINSIRYLYSYLKLPFPRDAKFNIPFQNNIVTGKNWISIAIALQYLQTFLNAKFMQLINNINENIVLSGNDYIENIILGIANSNYIGSISLSNYARIKNLLIPSARASISLSDYANISKIIMYYSSSTITLQNNAIIGKYNVYNSGDNINLYNLALIKSILFYSFSGSLTLNNYSFIKDLYINNFTGTISLNDNSSILNLNIVNCNGTINIASTAKIYNMNIQNNSCTINT